MKKRNNKKSKELRIVLLALLILFLVGITGIKSEIYTKENTFPLSLEKIFDFEGFMDITGFTVEDIYDFVVPEINESEVSFGIPTAVNDTEEDIILEPIIEEPIPQEGIQNETNQSIERIDGNIEITVPGIKINSDKIGLQIIGNSIRHKEGFEIAANIDAEFSILFSDLENASNKLEMFLDNKGKEAKFGAVDTLSNSTNVKQYKMLFSSNKKITNDKNRYYSEIDQTTRAYLDISDICNDFVGNASSYRADCNISLIDKTLEVTFYSDYFIDPKIIIEIIKALHLDSNREFISDIYEEVRALDGIWSEAIPAEHYVRVTFERNLTKDNDITLYPRIINETPKIEVYEFNKTEIIAEFIAITSNKYNKVLLTDLNGSQDIFDLRILGGGVEFEHIVDPASTTIYNFSDLDDGKKAWCIISGADTPKNPVTSNYNEWNVSGGCANSYSNLNSNDNNRDTDSGGPNGWINHWYNFSAITELVADITAIEVKWIGYDQLSSGDDFEFDIWNFSSSSWLVINTTTTAKSSDVTYGTTFSSANYNLSEFIRGGDLYLGISGAFGGAGPPICLGPDTKINTTEGLRKINELKVGDKIYSYNEKTKAKEIDEVVGVGSRSISNYGNKYFYIYYDEDLIKSTLQHLFYVNSKYVFAKDLKVGDELLTQDGTKKKISKIEIVEDYDDYVWWINTKNNDNFFSEGVLTRDYSGENRYDYETLSLISSSYIYSLADSKYKYETNVLGGFDSKKNENIDVERLQYLAWQNPIIKISNELKEIEYIDYLRLNVTYLNFSNNKEFSIIREPINVSDFGIKKLKNIDEDYLVLYEDDNVTIEFENLEIEGTKIISKDLVVSGYYERLEGWEPKYKQHHSLFTNYVEVTVTYTTADTTAPVITNALVNVSNNASLNQIIKINATVTDDVAISNVTIQVDPPSNNPYNITAPSQSGDEFFNDTVVLSQTGQWIFIFHANDTSANNATQATVQTLNGETAVNVSAAPDTTAPTITITAPLNNTNHSTARIDLNVSSTSTDVSRWWYTNSSGSFNSSFFALGTNLTGGTQPTWDEGHNFIRVYINDTLNNINSTYVNFTVDTIAPRIYLDSPVNNTNYSYSTININVSAVESTTLWQYWWYSNNSGVTNSSSQTPGTNLSLTWDEGHNFVYVWVNDSVNNLNYTTANFTVDTIPPTISRVFDFSLDEDFGNFTLDLTANESDVGDSGTNLNWNLSLNQSNIVSLFTSNQDADQFNFTSIANISGSVNVSLILNDSVGLTDTSSFILTIDPVNDPPDTPTISDNSTDEDTLLQWNVSSYLNDIDNIIPELNLSLTFSTSIASIVWDNSTKIVNVTPTANQSGNFHINFTISDLEQLSATQNNVQFTINPINDPPWWIRIPDNNTNEDTVFDWNLTFWTNDLEDSDGPDLNISFIVNTTSLANFSMNNNTNVFTITPGGNLSGSMNFNFTLFDSGGLTATTNIINFTINPINDAPTISRVFDLSLDEDFGNFTLDLTANESDVEDSGTDLDWTLSLNQSDIVSLFTSNLDADMFNFTSTANITGSINVSLVLEDSGGARANSSFILTIDPVNDPPQPPTLNSPANETNFTSIQTLSWNNGSDIDSANILYRLEVDTSILFDSLPLSYVNNTIAETASPTNDTPTGLTDNLYYWRVRSRDTEGLNSTYAGPRIFRIDTTAPSITISSPLNNTNHSTPTLTLNISSADITTLSEFWWYSNNSGTTNSSPNVIGTNLTLTWDEGSNVVIVYVNDTVGNENSTSVDFTVDTIAPRIYLDSPVNNTNYSYSTININVSAVETTTLWSYWWYSNNSGVRNSSSQTPGTNLSLTWDEGHNFVYVWVNDSVNNLNYTTANFTVDTVSPRIYLDSPVNNSNYSYSTININVSAVESTTLWQYWWYSNNSGVTNSSSQTPGTNLSLTWDEGHNFVYVWVNDSVNNLNYTTANFTVDTTNPSISNALINATSPVALNTIVKVNATVTDNVAIGNVTIQVDSPNDAPFNTTAVQSGDEFFNDTVVLSQAGQWVFIFHANDTSANNATQATAQDLAGNNYIEVESAPGTGPDGGGSPGGGGSSSGAGTSTSISSIIQNGSETTYLLRSLGVLPLNIETQLSYIPYITINPSKESENVEIKVEEIANPRVKYPGKVYKYFEVKTTNLPDSFINNVVFTLRIPVRFANPILYRYNNEKWALLPTVLIAEEGNFNLYEAESPGLSLFAIAYKAETEIQEELEPKTFQLNKIIKRILQKDELTNKDYILFVIIPLTVLFLIAVLFAYFIIKIIKKHRKLGIAVLLMIAILFLLWGYLRFPFEIVIYGIIPITVIFLITILLVYFTVKVIKLKK